MSNATDDAFELGELDNEESSTFPPADRKVVTQPYDLAVQTLVEQWKSSELILPEIQREYVWDEPRASRLIESLLLNIPIPVLYFAENRDSKNEIIDGHQRVRSVVRFLENEFPLQGLRVLNEYNRKRYFELPEKEQRFLRLRTLRAIVITAESHPTMKFEIFERLNTGSIILNAQELRNSLYRGDLNQALRDCAKSRLLRLMVGTSLPRKRMVDEELVLRFFALREGLPTYRPPLKRFLNDYMGAHTNPPDDQLDDLKGSYQSALVAIEGCLGTHAFRLIDEQGELLEQPVNKSLYDSQMLAFSWVVDISCPREDVVSRLGALYRDGEFLDSIRRATGDRSRTLHRVRATVGALREAGVQLALPYSLDD